MVSFRMLVAASAALVAVAAAGKYTTTEPPTTMPKYGKYGYHATTMPPKVYHYHEDKCKGKTPGGERCAGAPGHPYIKWLGCCDGYECVEDKKMGWGRFCKPSAPKCYKEGERCIGAPGKPYVEYMECCGDDMWCAKDEKMGWGSFCKKMPKDYYGYPEPTKAPKDYYGYPEPTKAPKDYYGYPTAAPKKHYGYPTVTVPPYSKDAYVDDAGYYAGYYYGKKSAGKKAVDPFAAFGADFGCPGGPLAVPDAVFTTAQPFMMMIEITIESCGASIATLSDEDVTDVLNSLCASFQSVEPTTECRISGVAAPSARMLELDTVDRQITPAPTTTTTTTTGGAAGGVTVTFEFQGPADTAVAVLQAASDITGPIGGTITPVILAATTAPPTTTTTAPMESPETA